MGEATLIPPTEARTLSPRIVRVWRFNAIIWAIGIALSALVVGALLEFWYEGWIAAAAAMTAGLMYAAAWPPARYRHWSFAVHDTDVVIRRGVWWRVTSIVPHARIQHVDTTHGPLEHWLGLSSVVLYTAGNVGASIKIPGLPAAEADELRDRLAALARIGEAV